MLRKYSLRANVQVYTKSSVDYAIQVYTCYCSEYDIMHQGPKS